MNTFRIIFNHPKKASDLALEIVAPTLEEARRIARERADASGFRNYRLARTVEEIAITATEPQTL